MLDTTYGKAMLAISILIFENVSYEIDIENQRNLLY